MPVVSMVVRRELPLVKTIYMAKLHCQALQVFMIYKSKLHGEIVTKYSFVFNCSRGWNNQGAGVFL